MHGRKNKPLTRPGGHEPPGHPKPPHPALSPGGGEGGVSPGEGQLPAFITAQADGVTLAIKLQPRASKNEIGEASGPELRIKVTAPPVDAAANEALLRLLADTLDCPRSKVELIRGHTARHKVVKVYGVTAAAIMAKLRE
jgi:hypothetical protein